jgi:hypothetical protein
MIDHVEDICAPAAIERALSVYIELQERDQSVLLQARKKSHSAYLRNGR